MVKIGIDKLRGIAPVGKDVEIEYEDPEAYDGNVKKLTLRLYPLTVEEELEIQQRTEENKIQKTDEPEVQAKKAKAQEEGLHTMILYALRKAVDGITLEDVKNLPFAVKERVISEIYLFKGIDLSVVKKKELENALNQGKP